MLAYISWCEFAKAIFEASNIEIKLNPIKTSAYPTPAKRPVYSVMDKTKIKNKLKVETLNWSESLLIALKANVLRNK